MMGAVDRIPKNGYNDHFNYKFVRAVDVFDSMRKLLIEHKLLAYPTMTGKEIMGAKTVLTFDITLVDIESGEKMVIQWSSEANDTQDKGFNKAETALMKYFFITFFLIPTGDGDLEDENVGGKQAEQTPAQKAAADKLADDRKRFIANANAKGYINLDMIGNACEKYHLSIDKMTYEQMAKALPVYVAA